MSERRYLKLAWRRGDPIEWVGEGNYRYDVPRGRWVRCGDAFAPVMVVRAADLMPVADTGPEGSERDD